MGNQLRLTNVINVSVSATPVGASNYNTSNVALFSDETPGGGFPGSGYAFYVDPTGVGVDFGTNSKTYKMALALFSQQPNILSGGGQLIVILLTPAETLDHAITRTKDTVQYFGIIVDQTAATITSVNLLAAAAVVQALNKILLVVSYTEADIQPGGMIDQLRTGGFTQTRGLYYDDSSSGGLNALLMCAAYAGRAFSTNFSGSRTTQDMHLKTLATIQPDPNMTQTILNEALAAGADTYVSLQGVPSVFCSGTNSFFDQVYNAQWIGGAYQIAYFNFLKQTSTKVPQTEQGMDGVKAVLRGISQQAVTNGYVAPGAWNSPVTFGNQNDLIANILQVGYYIFSTPVNQQNQADRAARKAPLVQIALKEAGSIESGQVIVNINP